LLATARDLKEEMASQKHISIFSCLAASSAKQRH